MVEEDKLDNNEYRSMAKGTAKMGGVQVSNILIYLIRGKLVALVLGPQGMGVLSLLQSSGNMIQRVFSSGLNFSGMKEVANSKDNRNHIIAIIRRVVLISSIIGAFSMIALSTVLSNLSFVNTAYTWYYVTLSIRVFFTWVVRHLWLNHANILLVIASLGACLLSAICLHEFVEKPRENG